MSKYSKFVLLSALVIAAPVFAQDASTDTTTPTAVVKPTGEIKEDRLEVHDAKKDLAGDVKAVHEDKREIAADIKARNAALKAGDKESAAALHEEVAADKAALKDDAATRVDSRKDVHTAKKELVGDKKDRRDDRGPRH